MPLTPAEAADTLRDIDATARRSANVYGYRSASPHLILWGVIWAMGYTTSYFRPQWSVVWIALVIAGSACSFWIGARMKSAGSEYDWRFAATALAIFLFICALFAIMPPHDGGQAGAFFPMTAKKVNAGIAEYLRDNGFANVMQLVGSLRTGTETA